MASRTGSPGGAAEFRYALAVSRWAPWASATGNVQRMQVPRPGSLTRSIPPPAERHAGLPMRRERRASPAAVAG
jgi:hypothetical protein